MEAIIVVGVLYVIACVLFTTIYVVVAVIDKII